MTDAELPKIHGKAVEIAAKEFQRFGNMPHLRIRRHVGTGVFSVSALPDDCENGMLSMVREVPPNVRGGRSLDATL